jgi:hypothetical protein
MPTTAVRPRAKRLDRIDRTIQRLERDVGIANEAFAIFIRFWLTSTAPLPESVQAAAHVKGGERYDKFLEALGRRLAKDHGSGRNCRKTVASLSARSLSASLLIRGSG